MDSPQGVGPWASLTWAPSEFRVDSIPVRGPLRHLGKLGCVRSDPYEPTSTGIGVGRGGAATQNALSFLVSIASVASLDRSL